MSKVRKKRVGLTIDPEVWARCQEIGKKFDLNWSQIAEEAFVNVLQHMEELEKILNSMPSDLQRSAAKANLKGFIERTYTDLNQELEEEIPESNSKSKKEE